GEVSELSQRQLGWLRGLAAAADLTGPDQGAWLDVLDAELDNIQAGLEWGVTAAPGPMLELAGALASFWQARGHIGLGRSWLIAALAAAGAPLETGAALSGLGRLALHTGDLEGATEYYRAAMDTFSGAGDLRRASLILGNLGVVAL